MQNKNDNFSIQEARHLAETPTGQQLIALLRSTGDKSIDEARRHAANGDMEQAKQSLSGILNSPKIRALLKEMEKDHE